MKYISMNQIKHLITFALVISCLPCAYAKDQVVRLGDALEYMVPAVAAGISWGRDDMDGFWQLAKAEATTAVMTEGLKASIHSQRPNREDNKSFPSGHASITFTAAHYLNQRYGWEYGVPAYLTSIFVAYSRVHGDEHRWRDVLGGAVLGIASAQFFTESKTSQLGFQTTGKTSYLSFKSVW